MAFDYKVQRNKLYNSLLKTKKEDGNSFLQNKYSYQQFSKRFFDSDQGVQDLYSYLTTRKKENGQFFIDPKYSLADFYLSYACDLSFAPTDYCKAKKTKYSGNYKDGKAFLKVSELNGKIFYNLELDEPLEIPYINQKFDPEFSGYLVNDSGNSFHKEYVWGQIKFNFIEDSNGEILKVVVEIVSKLGNKILKNFNFTKITSEDETPTPSPEQEPKKSNEKKDIPTFDFSPWECINTWNKEWGYFKLLGGYDGQQNFAFEFTSYLVNGRKVKLIYYKDGTVIMRYRDTNEDVPSGKGKWTCAEGNVGYTIQWQDGTVSRYSKEKGEEEKSKSGGQSPTPKSDSSPQQSEEKSKKFSEVCKSIQPCPTVDEVLNKKKVFKICMKCSEIQSIQNNPVLKVIYFRKLKENGFKEKTDGVFGPITKAAIEEYQQMNGLTKDGIVGPETYGVLQKDKSSRGA
jgi:peptidoglycan hydrolase-like protein with peptidoglycan-binding domain